MSFGKSSSKSQQQSQSTSSSQLDPQVLADIEANYGQAKSLVGSTTYNPVSAGQIQSYENPYSQAVIDATQKQLLNTNAQETSQNGLSAAATGDYNSSRLGVQNALTNQLNAQTDATTTANLENTNYNQALGAATTENTAANNFPLALQTLLNQSLGLGTSAQTSTSQSTGSGSSSASGVNFGISVPK